MKPLPIWAMPSTLPAVFDADSVTALESVARLHGVVRQLIEEYNELAESLQKDIESYEAISSAENQNFRQEVEKRLACKFKDLTAIVNSAKTELTEFATKWLQDNVPESLPVVTAADNGKIMMVSNGEWVPVIPALVYDEETESLNLNILGGI